MASKVRIIEALRTRLDLSPSEVSDAELLEKTKGTLTRAAVDMYLAGQDIKRGMAKAAPKWILKFGKGN